MPRNRSRPFESRREVKGSKRIVHEGDVLPASDPVVKAHADLFEPAEPT